MSSLLDLRPAGARSVLVELPGNASVRKLAAAARAQLAGLEEVVAGHDTVLLTWEPGRCPPSDLRERLAQILAGRHRAPEPAECELVVRYDGPDLASVAAHCGLSPEEVVGRHVAARYEVGFVGFAPGFAYLLGGDPALQPPRRESPRPRVPAGTLAIAGEYTAIYPTASPGGWQLIGHCDAVLFDLSRPQPALLPTGTIVRLRAART
ncbi:MAG: carboxyltransferase domain-containing protein [Patulibacter sp.]